MPFKQISQEKEHAVQILALNLQLACLQLV